MRWRSRGTRPALILAAACIAGVVSAAAIAPSVDTQLSSSTSTARSRVDLAAKESIDRYSEWLGPPPDSISVRDASSWRLVPAAMNVEMHVSYEIARQWFGRSDSVAVNAIAWYMQGRIVERLYDYAYHQPGHSGETVWFFGRLAPEGFPSLRLSRFTKPMGRFKDGARWPEMRPILPDSVDRQVLRLSTALASLERMAGWPMLQGALAEARRQSQSRALSSEDLGRILSDAMGIATAADILAWYQTDEAVDYAISAVEQKDCGQAGCVRTTVTVTAHGEAPRQPLLLQIAFIDGQHVDAAWDGRGTQSYEFESAAPMSAAHLDPERVVLRDSNWLNNDWLSTPSTNVPLSKWTARWMVWLQNATLTYSAGL